MDPAMMSNDMEHVFTPRKRQKREGARWSRSGCLTCKKRRKRCDEAKPSCHNCVRLGRVCEGYGSLWAEPLNPFATVFQQTDEQKRQGLSSSPVSSATHTSDGGILDINSISSSDLLEDDDDAISIDNHSQISSTSDLNALALVSAIPVQPAFSTNEAHYLQYHIEQGSKLLANLENDDNPLRSLLIPRALNSPLVMKATCAMSAMHFANRAQDGFTAKTAATKYYIQTVRELRGVLAGCFTAPAAITSSDGNSSAGSMISDELILAVGLLCKYEIVRGSVKQWAVHLGALRKLIIARGGYTFLDPEMAEFLWGFFMYADNVAKVTNQRYRHITASDVSSDVDADRSGVHITKLDIYIGYTEDILKLCTRIADLPSLDRAILGLEVSNIDYALQTWTPTSRTYLLPAGITAGAITRLQAVAECFRDAAYIYLHSILERIQFPSLTLPLSVSLSMQKCQALNHCLTRISTFNPGSDLDPHLDPELVICPQHCEYSALTFPLFIAGCECRSDTQIRIVSSTLERLEADFGIGNVRRVREVLGILWASGDGDGWEGRRHWLDVLEGLGWELIVA